jgi:hypothetical protein
MRALALPQPIGRPQHTVDDGAEAGFHRLSICLPDVANDASVHTSRRRPSTMRGSRTPARDAHPSADRQARDALDDSRDPGAGGDHDPAVAPHGLRHAGCHGVRRAVLVESLLLQPTLDLRLVWHADVTSCASATSRAALTVRAGRGFLGAQRLHVGLVAPRPRSPPRWRRISCSAKRARPGSLLAGGTRSSRLILVQRSQAVSRAD